jgi:hypothetical protein
LNEVQDFEDSWRLGIEMQDGRCDEVVLNRCRAYGVADDLLWGLWGLLLSHTSCRKDLAFLKFGEWRLLRARAWPCGRLISRLGCIGFRRDRWNAVWVRPQPRPSAI